MPRPKRKKVKVVLKPGEQEYIFYNGYQVKLTGASGYYNPDFHPKAECNQPPHHFFQYFKKPNNWQCLNCGVWLFGPVLPPDASGVRPRNPALPPCPEPMI